MAIRINVTSDVDKLQERMNRLRKDRERRVSLVKEQVTMKGVETAVRATPVDTGEARSNWQVGINRASRQVLPPYAPGDKLGIGESANAEATINAARSKLKGRKFKDTDNILIVNNVPYIEGLDNGTISQQGSNMVAKATQAMQQEIGRAFRRTR